MLVVHRFNWACRSHQTRLHSHTHWHSHRCLLWKFHRLNWISSPVKLIAIFIWFPSLMIARFNAYWRFSLAYVLDLANSSPIFTFVGRNPRTRLSAHTLSNCLPVRINLYGRTWQTTLGSKILLREWSILTTDLWSFTCRSLNVRQVETSRI